MGLSGLIVIGRPDGGSDQLASTPLAQEHLLGLQNALIVGNQINVPVMGSDVSVQTFTVNGQAQPNLDIAAQLMTKLVVRPSKISFATPLADVTGENANGDSNLRKADKGLLRDVRVDHQ